MNRPFIHIRIEGKENRIRGIARLDGMASWDWNGYELKVAQDPFGMSPIFYMAQGHEIIVSPWISQVLACMASRQLNYPGLAAFLRLGFFLGEDTAFENVHAMPPGAILQWSAGHWTLQSPPYPIEHTALSREQAIEAYIESFSTAVRHLIPVGDSAVLLSGGRDSRHILLELHRQKKLPKSVATIDRNHFNDAEITIGLAKELNVVHRLLPRYRPKISTQIQAMDETQYSTLEHAWSIDLRDALRGNVQVLWDGIAGDVLSAGLYTSSKRLQLYESGAYDALAVDIAENPEDLLRNLLTPEVYRLMSPDVGLQRLTVELRRHKSSANPIASFFFWNRTRRAVALSPYGIYREFQVLAPFLHKSVFSILITLPAEYVSDHEFHNEVIRRAYPEWSHVPFASLRTPIAPAVYDWPSLSYVGRHLSPWICRRYVVPRLIRSAMNTRYNFMSSSTLVDLPLYLNELSRLLQGEKQVSNDSQSKCLASEESHF